VASVETEELIRAFEEERARNEARMRELQEMREAAAAAAAEEALRQAEEKVWKGMCRGQLHACTMQLQACCPLAGRR
jgi:hypothetical protein